VSNYAQEAIGFLGNILNCYSMDRLEGEQLCSGGNWIFGNILNHYSIDRLEGEHNCSGGNRIFGEYSKSLLYR